MNTYYVYILQCDDQSYYVGITNNLERRIEEHKRGEKDTAYTSWNDSLKLLYYEECSDVEIAIAREKQLKGRSRKKKEMLIDGDIKGLKNYSSSN